MNWKRPFLPDEESTLIVPGDYFGMDHFMHTGFGLPPNFLLPALDRIHELLEELQ